VVPQLLALAAAGWLLGEFLAGRTWLSVAVLAGIQLVVHVSLNATVSPQPVAHSSAHEMTGHDMTGHDHMAGMTMPPATTVAPMHNGITDAVTMSLAHLAVLLAGVVLIGSTHRWAQRVLRILARLVPQLPAAVIPLPAVRLTLPDVPEQPWRTQRWLTSNVSRRGPPQYRVLTVPS
jgi:hypothetical protein